MHSGHKQEHLRICIENDTRSGTSTGLECYRLIHCALPELALDQVDTATTFVGHKLDAPLLIAAMTGGTDDAHRINLNLARAAQALGLAMGLGSQRAGIEEPALLESYQVRDVAPDILLLANLGAVQLNYGYGAAECRRAVQAVGADALVLHLNPLQEALQPEGNTDFCHLLARIADVCSALSCPVIAKEVGWGISPLVARELIAAGVAGLDVSGAGGTSWSKVEGQRSATPEDAAVAAAFDDWGLPTAVALDQVRKTCPAIPLIASGGIATGVDLAKCLALGADLVGMAHGLLSAALQSTEAVQGRLEIIIRQLEIAMFCTGSRDIAALDRTRLASWS